jgi:hypothetical protein
LKIDDQLEHGRLDDGQFGRFSSPQDFAGVDPNLPIGIGNVRTVGHQKACSGKFSEAVERGNPLPDGQRDEPIDVASEQCIACDEERAYPLLSKSREGHIKIILAANVQGDNRCT